MEDGLLFHLLKKKGYSGDVANKIVKSKLQIVEEKIEKGVV